MRQIIILSFLIVSLIISAFFIRLPYTINCSGKILPTREWIVRNADGGDIISVYNNHKTNPVYNFTNYKFDRGEIASFNFNENFEDRITVNKGDTIGYITSFLLSERLTQLKSGLNEEQAYLLALNSGEKSSLIEGAKNQYLLATQKFDQQEKNFERQKKLFDNGVIPEAEYEIALKDYELAKTDIDLAKNNQISLQTGEKPELINYTNVKISSFENEIKLLENKQKQYILIAPFDGKIITKKVALNNPEATTYHIFHLIDTTEYVVLLPIELFQRKYITKDISIEANILQGEQIETGNYIGEDQDVELTGAYKQVFIVKGCLKSSHKEIPYGIYATCTINCGDVTLFEYLKRKLKI